MFDTSSDEGLVSLASGDKSVSRLLTGSKLSALLLPTIHELLQQAALTTSDLDAIVTGVGPGSFTGIRVSISVALGLAMPHAIPIYPLSSLELLAQSRAMMRPLPSNRECSILVLCNAQSGLFYFGHYHLAKGASSVTLQNKELLLNKEEALSIILPFFSLTAGENGCQDAVNQRSWMGIGNGWRVLLVDTNDDWALRKDLLVDSSMQPNALLQLAKQVLLQSSPIDYNDFELNYLHHPF